MRKDVLNAIIQLEEVKKMINKAEVARRFNCSVNTVNKYLIKQEKKKNFKKIYIKIRRF